jgi:hypothetical protein
MLYISIAIIYLLIIALPLSGMLWAAATAAKWGDRERD